MELYTAIYQVIDENDELLIERYTRDDATQERRAYLKRNPQVIRDSVKIKTRYIEVAI